MNKFKIKYWWSDGSCSCNPGPGGWGVIQIENNKLEYAAYQRVKYTTNNRMELLGLLHATQAAAAQKDYIHYIYTDSNYCYRIINEWAKKWESNGWVRNKNHVIENLDIIKQLWEFYSQDFFNVEVKWIKGHNGTLENEIVDRLAKNEFSKMSNILKSNNIEFNLDNIKCIE